MSAAIASHAASGVPFPAEALRAQFPALQRAGSFIFFDNAAGAQVPQRVLDAVNEHLLEHNVQRGGRYPQSIAVDATIRRAREPCHRPDARAAQRDHRHRPRPRGEHRHVAGAREDGREVSVVAHSRGWLPAHAGP
jgi:hypothetical protein